MNPIRKREFPIYYAKGKTLFQIVVRISDAPGSLDAILGTLGKSVNMIWTSTFTLGDGTAMFSSFAEALSGEDTPETIKKAIGQSKAAIESEVREGKDGLLVDTFHSGLQVGSEDFMLLSRKGMDGVFDHIVKIFGTGGELLIYEEGVAMAKQNAERTSASLPPKVVRDYMPFLTTFLSAQGWGTFRSESGDGPGEYLVTVTDCFECAHGSQVRRKCDFLRGYFEGAGTVTLGAPIQAEEVECALAGGSSCSFRVSPRPTA